MGKQTDAISIIKRAFDEKVNLYAVDLDFNTMAPDRLKVSLVPTKGEYIDPEYCKELEERVFMVYSGRKQIAKLAEQRFTREDFSGGVV
jgi:hypothetical protein